MYSIDEWEDEDDDLCPLAETSIAQRAEFASKFPVCDACGGPYPNGKRGVKTNPAMIHRQACHGIGYTGVTFGPGALDGVQPGSETAIAVMAERLSHGLCLWTGYPLGFKQTPAV